MIRIHIAQSTVRELKGVSKTTQREYHLRFQTGYVFPVDEQGNPPPFPKEIELSLDKDQLPYAPGDYQLLPSSIYVNREGKLSVAPRLAPAKKASASAQA